MNQYDNVANIGGGYTSKLDIRNADGSIPQPRQGYPLVTLIDHLGQPLLQVGAADDGQGEYLAQITIPDMHLEERSLFQIKWEVRCTNGDTLRETQQLWVQPNQDTEFEDPVILFDDVAFEFYLPVLADPGSLKLTLYSANQQVRPTLTPPNELNTSVFDMSTKVNVNLGDPLPARLAAYNVLATYKVGGRAKSMTLELWVVTPTILQQVDYLERMIDKARVNNAIPSLQWRQCDWLMYLHRGLSRFNVNGQVLTNFTGLNMQGVLQELHNLCAAYEAVLAQRKAEGDLAFSFAGQAVTLEIQRQEALDALLTSLSDQIDNKLPQAKALLSKYGIVGGDGSDGDLQNISSRFQAYTSLGQAPTTQVNRPRPWSSNMRMRW